MNPIPSGDSYGFIVKLPYHRGGYICMLVNTIVGWLTCTFPSQLNTFCILHLIPYFNKGWNNVDNFCFYGGKKKLKFV